MLPKQVSRTTIPSVKKTFLYPSVYVQRPLHLTPGQAASLPSYVSRWPIRPLLSTRQYAQMPPGGGSGGGGFPSFMMQHQKGDALKEYVSCTARAHVASVSAQVTVAIMQSWLRESNL